VPRLRRHTAQPYALLALAALGVCIAAATSLRAAGAEANPTGRTHSIEQAPNADTEQSEVSDHTQSATNADPTTTTTTAATTTGNTTNTEPQPPAEPLDDTDIPANERLSLGESAYDDTSQDNNASNNNDLTDSASGSWVLDTVTALGVVVGLIFLLRWLYMKISGQPTSTRPASSAVEVLSRTTVAPRNHVLILRVGNRLLVVGDSNNGMRTLANIEDEEEVANILATVSAGQTNSVSRSFSQLLGRFGASHDQTDLNDPATLNAWANDDDGLDENEHLFDRARHNVSGLTSRIRTLSDKGKGGDL